MTTHNKKTTDKAQTAHPVHKTTSQSAATPTHEMHRAATAVASTSSHNTQTLLIFALVIAAFFGAYRFARANSPGAASVSTGITGAALQAGTGPGAGAGGAAAGGSVGGGAAVGGSVGGGSGGGCGGGCGGGGSSAPIIGSAKTEGGVQKIAVDVSLGYNPNTIQLKAGVPAEITFGQSGGCTAIVQSADLGFQEDLSTGPKTVKLGALEPGTYGFACGMDMVRGTIVVQ